MGNFIEFIVRFKDFITLSSLIVISALMISQGDTSKIGGFKAWVISNIGNFQSFVSIVPNSGSIENENKALRELNLKLSTELVKNRKATIENDQLRGIIGFEETYEKDILPVEVLGATTVSLRNYITIASGIKDSIKIGMPVRTDVGLVGMVAVVSENYSLVELLKNKETKIAVKVIRPKLQGILEWIGSNNFILKNIPETYDIKPNDVLVTSNYSNKYPDGIPVGVVKSVGLNQNSLFLKIEIESYVDFNSLSHVFVVKELPNEERIQLIEELEKKLQVFN